MTTNNHPAHGPVSLDRLHQISEILSKAAAQSDGGNLGYAMADAVKVIDEVLEARNAEPVVLDEDPRDAFERSFKMPKHVTRCGTGYAVTEYSAWLAHDFIRMWEGWKACRAAMLKSFGNSEQLDEVGSWDNHMNTPTDKPAINTDELLKHIEGMEVSVDVSTCDADAGHRYFGTVTEISELDTARNGYILLVQDAKPNFKPAGNSPATPDGWQLVPKEPTEAMNKAGWAAMNEHDAINPTYRAMLAAAPQQDVRLALEIGMSRYAGAMQKLVDSGD
ncbi:hypothetical protein NFJ76_08875 [Citrobacter freundii]|uniref:hypothetical protein n=1 Tax=Citrobacter freundii TaxID=546 RepID=UPI002433859C|nr:hypothetical protein [Citrobacter freundii]WFW62053.1 hypothetical protein NFJ76_08875 [Citrobacter freundii]